MTPSRMHFAVWMHDQVAVRNLLAFRCSGSPWYRNALVSSAFDVAVTSGCVEAARAIFAAGEIGEDVISVPNGLGGTNLQAAAENGHQELVQMLLDLRAEVNAPKPPHSKYGSHGASMKCWDECCKLLFQCRACADTKDSNGVRLLTWLAWRGPSSSASRNLTPARRPRRFFWWRLQILTRIRGSTVCRRVHAGGGGGT